MKPAFPVNYDVVIVGGGNAALCAAITAQEAGAKVLLLESAPRDFRGGNSRHTRNLRLMHDAPQGQLTGSYAEAEYWDDLRRVTAGKTDEDLARFTIRESASLMPWMEARGVRFQRSLSGTLNLSRTNAFFLGGGKALVNAYYATAERLGVAVQYESEVQSLRIEDGAVTEVVVKCGTETTVVTPRSVVVASGGYQANIEWLKENWGTAAENFVIRGTPYDRGRVLRSMIEQGAALAGDPMQFHAVAVDGRAPRMDGGIVTRLDCIPFSIVVDRNGRRFYDEGQDLWPKRYAIWGRLVAQQSEQIAFAIFDRKSERLFMPSIYPAIRAQTIGELAENLGLDSASLEKTVSEFNAAIRPGGTFDSTQLDDCTTDGLEPPKSHWARAIDTPPFSAYPLRPGITFTYLGVRVDERARVALATGSPCRNLFAAGEVMAGNILGQGYLAGLGMAIGTVFGRIAGREAAVYAIG